MIIFLLTKATIPFAFKKAFEIVNSNIGNNITAANNTNSIDNIGTGAVNTFDKNLESGAIVTFQGQVRSKNHNQEVILLEYEAYEDLAQREGTKILTEAQIKFNLQDIFCYHRLGSLKVGEIALWLQIKSSHRMQAFQASQWIVDEIKSRLPIWKKEHYIQGQSHWINNTNNTNNTVNIIENTEQLDADASIVNDHDLYRSHDKELFFEKQLVLPKIMANGQNILLNSHAVVIGAGGLACGALPHLVGAGIGRIDIIDFDSVKITNLYRQNLYNYTDCGKLKATAAAKYLQSQNPFIDIRSYTTKIDHNNIFSFIQNCDVILDTCDNQKTKLLIHDSAFLYKKKLVQASVYQWEGQIQVFDFQSDNRFLYPCGYCYKAQMHTHTQKQDRTYQMATTSDSNSNVASDSDFDAEYIACVETNEIANAQSTNTDSSEVSVFGPVVGTVGALQASEAIKLILCFNTNIGFLTIIDLMTLQIDKLHQSRNQDCLFCRH